jgi:hypothetical protein
MVVGFKKKNTDHLEKKNQSTYCEMFLWVFLTHLHQYERLQKF